MASENDYQYEEQTKEKCLFCIPLETGITVYTVCVLLTMLSLVAYCVTVTAGSWWIYWPEVALLGAMGIVLWHHCGKPSKEGKKCAGITYFVLIVLGLNIYSTVLLVTGKELDHICV